MQRFLHGHIIFIGSHLYRTSINAINTFRL